ncbi:MAG TPA: ferritin-like domain-containing protein [Chthoniobacterales bacterium]|jgi:hypothetical protein
MHDESIPKTPSVSSATLSHLPRRSFLKIGGALLATTATALLSERAFAAAPGAGVSLGSGDVAVMNYAYVLEQLEAEFYILVMQSPYRGMTARERQVLTDIRDHEIAHVDFFRAALGTAGIGKLQFNWSQVNFADRASVLTTARMFEDTGVSAYNGAGQLLKDPAHLILAGKIVSVEARHAAILHDLLEPRSNRFAGPGVVDEFGLDPVASPSEVMKKVAPFIVTPIDTRGLPKA